MNEAMLAGEAKFWNLAQPLLGRAEVTRSAMMGLPCLRWNGAFFASCDRRTGDLLLKLAETRVDELADAGRANPFAPAGRRFREWAAIPETRSRTWKRLLDEALEFRYRASGTGQENEEAVTSIAGFSAAAWEFLDGLAGDNTARYFNNHCE